MANIPLQSISFPGLSDKYTTPTVDATLTQTGAAADAKKTGDEISGLKNDFTQLESGSQNYIVGYGLSTDGTTIATDNVSASDYISVVGGHRITVITSSQTPSPSQNMRLIEYDQSKNLVDYWTANPTKTLTLNANTAYIRFSFNTGFGATATDETTSTLLYTPTKTESLNNRIYNILVTDTATGAIASFSDGADDVPVKDLTVAIEPVQSGSGDPSPSNVRPISGWTGANVTMTGANLWGGEKFKDDILRIVPSSSVDETAKTVGYQASFVNGKILFTNFKPNTQYTVILKGYNTSTETQATNIALEYTDGTQERGTDFINGVAIIKSNPAKSVKNIIGVWSTQITYLYYNECGVFKGDLTANDFVPYQGETHTIDWTTEAGTVYGGTLDVSTGVLTVDRAYEEFNLANYPYTTTNGFDVWSLTAIAVTTAGGDANGKICNITTYAYSSSALGVNHYYITVDTIVIFLEEGTARDKTASFVYPLVTPQTIQLTAHEVSTILGQNNIFADTGNVTVQYRADTKLYIDKVLNA